nr:ankyrin repeat domain-containing protein [Thetidibacter halocola]
MSQSDSPCPTDGDGETPLIKAATRGHSEVVAALLEAGCPVDQSDRFGRTALTVAVLHDREAVVTLLRAAGATVAPPTEAETPATPLLHAASAARNDDLVRELVSLGWSANPRDANGMTPLIALAEALTRKGYSFAAELSAERMVKTLLAAGADPDAIGPEGRSALHFAVLSGREMIVTALLDGGADPDLRDAAGHTPLFYAMTWNAYLKEPLFTHGASRRDRSMAVAGFALLCGIGALCAAVLWRARRRGFRPDLAQQAVATIVCVMICGALLHMAMRVDFWFSDPFEWIARVLVGTNWQPGPVFASHGDCVAATAPAAREALLQYLSIHPEDVERVTCSYRVKPSPLWSMLDVVCFGLAGCLAVLAVPGRASALAVLFAAAGLGLVEALSFPEWTGRLTAWQSDDPLGFTVLASEAGRGLMAMAGAAAITAALLHVGAGRRRG